MRDPQANKTKKALNRKQDMADQSTRQSDLFVSQTEMDALDASHSIVQAPSETTRQLLSDTALQRLCEEVLICSVCDHFLTDITEEAAKWYALDRLNLGVLAHKHGSWPKRLIEQFCGHPSVRTKIHTIVCRIFTFNCCSL